MSDHHSVTLNVVLVDDNRDHLDAIETGLRRRAAAADDLSVQFMSFNDPAKALAGLPTHGDVIILCGQPMHGDEGVGWLMSFIDADVGPVISVSESGNEHLARDSFRAGAADYLIKDEVLTRPELICAAVQASLERHRMIRGNRTLNRQLKLANSELERKNKTLGELMDTAHSFVDDVAHEFRTPLAVIKEFASIIADGIGGDITVKQAEYLRFIIDASRDLAMLVEDFLDSGKLRARTLRVDRRRHAVTEIVDAVRPMLHARAAAKNIRVIEEIDPDLPNALVDPEKAGRVVLNLMVNAIKFAPEGSDVQLWARRHDQGVAIGVTDRGPGISEEELALIFQRFRQVGDVQRSGIKGFGLGLAIAREMVWLNLGETYVESTFGEGSTFWFTLPPDDPDVALEWYLARILEGNSAAALSALRVEPEDDGEDPDGLRSFLTSVCHPMDFMLPSTDGRSIILVGHTVEPDNWTARLKQMRSDHAELHADVAIGPIRITTIGTWPADRARDPILASTQGATSELRNCA